MKSEFTIKTDQIEFRTMTNGDRIDIRGVHLGKESAANLAWLINNGDKLKITIKSETEE